MVVGTTLQGVLWRGHPKSFELQNSKLHPWGYLWKRSVHRHQRVTKAPVPHQSCRPAQTRSLAGKVPLVAGGPHKPLTQERLRTGTKVKQDFPRASPTGQRTLEPPPGRTSTGAEGAVTLLARPAGRAGRFLHGAGAVLSSALASLILPRQRRLLPAACLCINCREIVCTYSILPEVKARGADKSPP